MQQSPNYSPSFNSTDPEANTTFNVVIAYEDFETGKKAKGTYDFLVQNLGPECDFENQMWKFDVLGIPKLMELAAKDAANADIVIISCHSGSHLPEEVVSWMELWIEQKHNAIALVGLFDAPF